VLCGKTEFLSLRRTTLRAITLLVALVLVGPSICRAENKLSIDLGYVDTSSRDYSFGLVYGVSITEGSGKVGFGVLARRFANTVSWQTEILVDKTIQVFEYQETFSDFYISGMATFNLRNSHNETFLLAGLGPQIHFLTATKLFVVEGVEITGRDFRLGVGAILRYQHSIGMFGGTALVLTGAYSWASSVEAVKDDYAPPTESLTFSTITAGLAFAF